jgi:outer membrane protein assembly factor BamB
MRKSAFARTRLVVVAALLVTLAPRIGLGEPGEQARKMLDATDTRGGLVVHLGCGDGTLTAALRANERFVVQGLDPDPADVAKARAHARSAGLTGAVSIRRFSGKRLPYSRNLVNLLVAEEPGGVPMEEVQRVLVPGGAAYVKQNGKWKKTVKPWPGELDEWSHYLHNASNNAVAEDTAVRPPRRMQWVAGPLWCRSHEFVSSFAAMVSAGGRVFYVLDEGLTGVTDPRLPERWRLIARDAFNGVLLWKQSLPHWRGSAWRNSSLRGRPPSVPRRIVADEAHLYATLSHDAPLAVLDAATGKTLRTVEGTANAEELVLSDGTLVVRLAAGQGQRGKASESVVAVEAPSGQVQWRVDAGRVAAQSLAAANGRVLYSDGKRIVCLRLADGKELWRTDADGKRWRRKTLLLHGDVVLAGDGSAVTARHADTGKTLWTARGGGQSMRGQDLFVAQGLVWRATGQGVTGYDPATGKIVKTIDASSVQTPGHHLRCYRAKATERYLITQFRGAEFVSLTDAPHAQNDWIRGACTFGVMPANGLLYVPPDPCFCYPGAKVNGLLALAGSDDADAPQAGGRLEKGRGYDEAAKLARARSDGTGSWPTYRHDTRRSGSASCEVPPKVTQQWKAKLQPPLTPPVAAQGHVYVAAKDAHTLHALRESDGQEAWRFTAGGRIDSPPTAVGGLVLFGCADGYVYCLRAADGAMLWRFRAAPSEEQIIAFGRLESPWRVHGSVLVSDGIVYCTAGRSSFLDGGIRLVALEPGTGRLAHEARLDTWSRTRQDAEGKPFIPAYHMEGAQSDVLVSQGGRIFLGQYAFDHGLHPLETPYAMPAGEGSPLPMDLDAKPFVVEDRQPNRDYETHQRQWLERTQKGLLKQLRGDHGGWSLGERRMGRHVLATAGFLDDSWYNRTYWMYADVWPGFYIAHRGAKTGQLLVVGPEKTYAVQAYPSRNLQSPLFTPGTTGYLLFADRNDNEPVLGRETRGTTKGWGYTRTKPPVWYQWVPVRIRAMTLAGGSLFAAGPPDVLDPQDPMAAFEGRKGAVLRAHSARDGAMLAEQRLGSPPIFDGLIAAHGRLYLCTEAGSVLCFGPE